MHGRRIPDGEHPVQPGDYGKLSVTDDVACWIVMAPNGTMFVLANALTPGRDGRAHEVQEHADGTITVEPRPGNTNSILAPERRGVGWHGYIRHGVWEQLP